MVDSGHGLFCHLYCHQVLSYMRNILHIQKVAGIAGSENHLLTLLPELKKHGYEPTMLVLADSEDRPEPFIEQMRDRGVPTDLISMGADMDPFLVLRLVCYLKKHPFELIHTHLFHADIYGTIAARLAGFRQIISTKHGFNPWRNQALYAFLDRMAAKYQQQLIAISKAIGEWLVEVERLPAHKMQLVHYAIDMDKFRPSTPATQELLNIPKPIIGTVTRLLHQKGVHVLLDAFAKCLETYPKASLVIVGDGPVRRQLEEQSRTLSIAAQTHFLGHVAHPTLGDILEAFDIFAFPTFGEGFGLVLLEAMTSGKPVVASKVMAIPEIVIDGETGLLVPPDNADALGQALLKLMSDPSKCQQFGTAGRHRVEAEFTVDRMVQKTIGIYERVVSLCHT